MLFLAAEAEAAGGFDPWDIFMILFTIVIAIGFVRLIAAKQKNLFAIGFAGVSLAVFLFLDVLMVRNWFGLL
ncbi:DUF2759 family protein [Longirhabdus pacifica]|uniref:DUF2759 family protein n=1 Tax=Longirhabdus pacifica TaxID=2305227 RepID=UPI001008CF37|nr:DUF2759 family protein [Longirhabdus pacifica]